MPISALTECHSLGYLLCASAWLQVGIYSYTGIEPVTISHMQPVLESVP